MDVIFYINSNIWKGFNPDMKSLFARIALLLTVIVLALLDNNGGRALPADE
jgi:hypothetical protein